MRSAPFLLLVSILLAACGGEEFQDLRDFVKNAGADMRGKIPPPPEIKPYEPFVYNNDADLPNPFKPRKPELRTGGQGGINQPDLARPREALEEFPLESLKMVGYLYQNNVGYAVIRAPDRKLHRVKAGNYVGMNFGLIQEVTDTGATIKEMVQDSVGDWNERDSSLQLLE
ncbi:MAG: pilus assembly protein PilP [Gallionellales bacterium GWA2_60_18]|nr:MAG: pilus assembly protein PilP [Gallionellales bacterium GWA2_60_18]